MELIAAIESLKNLEDQSQVELYSDSKYVVDGITKWVIGWRKNGWQTSKRSPVLNRDLWRSLDEQNCRLQVTWHWVKGHAGHPENERVDVEARERASALSQQQ